MTDESGLNVFHDNASAAGNFPTALRGYDRASVDEYVRTLERRAVETQQRNRDLDQRVRQLEDELSRAQTTRGSGSGQPSAEGEQNQTVQASGRAAEVLRTADVEAREVVKRAQLEAQGIVESARRDAANTQGQADRSATDLQMNQRAEIDGMRKRVQADAIAQVTKARDEAGTIVGAARREAEALRLQVTQETDAYREQHRLEAGAVLAQAEREAAELRAGLAQEREQHAAALIAEHTAHTEKLAGLLGEAQQFHAQSGEQLAKETEDAARVRTEALAEAERTRIRVAREAEEIVGTAKRQAATLQQRMHEQFTQGKDRLRRETDLLNDRKKAVLAQLASLSEWAQQGATNFPDVDPDSDLADLEKAFDAAVDTAATPTEDVAEEVSEDAAEPTDEAPESNEDSATEDQADNAADEADETTVVRRVEEKATS